MDENNIIVNDPGQALRRAHKQTKLTRKRMIEVLDHLGKDFNLSKAAAKIGVHRDTITRALRDNPQFKAAVDDVKDAYIDTIQSSGLTVALQPTREGYNDRKLMLEAHRREVYKPANEGVQVNVQLNIENTIPTVTGILQKYNAVNADYKTIPADEHGKLDTDNE